MVVHFMFYGCSFYVLWFCCILFVILIFLWFMIFISRVPPLVENIYSKIEIIIYFMYICMEMFLFINCFIC